MKNILKNDKLALLIFAILFFVPTFWFNKGQVDYGGDSTRLYFYDPFSWLNNIALYFVNPLLGMGMAIPNSTMIPFLTFLTFMKRFFFHTGYSLNNFFNGLLLAGGFFSIYLIVRELLKGGKDDNEKTCLPAIISGLFFVFSPIMVPQWERALYSINQIFVYPFVFLLFLKFVKTNKKYLLALIPIFCLIFSVNFSFGTMPWFIAFFSFSFVFLFIYSSMRGYSKRFAWGLVIFSVLIFAVMAFDTMVQIYNSINPSGLGYRMIFNKDATVDMSLPYFLSIQPHVRLVYNLLNQDQFVMTKGVDSPFWDIVYKFGIRFLPVFSVYPLIAGLGMVLTKKEDLKNRFRELNLVFVFFLILLFFMSANITDTGLAFYKALFHLPGFGMFRSFYSKFALSYIFFYSILLGYCLTIIFNKIGSFFTRITIFVLLVGLITYNGWPLISGRVPNGTLWRTDKVSFASEIDTKYELFINRIKEEKPDFKILAAPWANESYQVLKGNGGVYFGPSSLPIFTGRNTFTGQVSFSDFWPYIQSLIEQNKFEQVSRMLSLLNVGYLFYNQDEYIYNNFPNYPYSDWLRDRFPKQKQIGKLVEDFDFNKLFSIGNYNLYKIRNNYLLPHFYVSNKIIYSRNGPEVLFEATGFNDYDIRSAFYLQNNIENPSPKENEYVLKSADRYFIDGKSKDIANLLSGNYIRDVGAGYPGIKNLSFFQWLFASIQERIKETKLRKNVQLLISEKILNANKRVNAVTNYKGNEVFLFKTYRDELSGLMKMLKDEKDPDKKVALSFTLKYNLEDNNKKLLLHKPNNFEDWESLIGGFLQTVNPLVPVFSPDERQYSLSVPESGDYLLFMDEVSRIKNEELVSSIENCEINIGEDKIEKVEPKITEGSISLGTVNLTGNPTIKINFCQPTNLLAQEEWKVYLPPEENKDPFVNIDGFVLPQSKMILYKDIPDWEAESLYQINGTIKANDKVKVVIGEKRMRWVYIHKKNKLLTKYDTLRELEVNHNLNGENFKFEVKSSAKVSSAKIFIYYMNSGGKNEEKPVLEADNVVLRRLLNPRLFLKSATTEEKTDLKKNPKITFSKVNPTKYRINVQGAKDPFTLVFSEQFHSSWNIYPGGSLSASLGQNKTGFWGILGRAGTKLAALALSDSGSNEVVADYFDGDINEKKHQSIFLEPATFETWGKSPIAQDRHFLVNNYANSWYILPEDTAGKEDYDLVVEFKPQRIYYLGFFISGATLICCLIFLIAGFIKEEIFVRNENRN